MKQYAMLNYYNNLETLLLDSCTNNSKLYWKLLKETFSKNKSTELPPLQNVPANGDISLVFDNDEKVELATLCENTFSQIVITEQDIVDIMSILPVNKAIGNDCISHRMLKTTLNVIAKPLCKLFNRSLKYCIFPSDWKIANGITLFKTDDPSLLSNYRPVSLLSCIAKVMERVMFKYMYNFLRDNNFFYKYEAGFLPGHSTVYQLIETLMTF
jgi:hypothetical protein